MNAPISDVAAHERPISEQYRIVAKQWVDADAAARLLEDLKTTTLEQKKSDHIAEHGTMPDNKAEREVKSSEDWEDFIRQMVDARTEANKKKAQLEYIRMKFSEWQSKEATARAERRL
jgi:hypothetical protein